jgi:hypothetical protein
MLTREGDIWWRGKPEAGAAAASARLGVGASPFYESLGERFRNRMDAGTFTWLASKLEHGARPHHNVHIFGVYLRAVLTRGNHANVALDRMDSRRISWACVAAVELREGKLALTEPQVKRITRQIEGHGFADGTQVGDFVSIHWNWVCEVLDASALRGLMANTRRYLALGSQTL